MDDRRESDGKSNITSSVISFYLIAQLCRAVRCLAFISTDWVSVVCLEHPLSDLVFQPFRAQVLHLSGKTQQKAFQFIIDGQLKRDDHELCAFFDNFLA